MKAPPWSYSGLTSFETCARRHWHIKVAKDVVEDKHQATLWGTEVHSILEARAGEKTALPPELASYEPLVSMLESVPGELVVEKQLAVTSDFRPTYWESDDAWCRGIIDIGVVSGTTAVLLDWKTGKRKPDSDQLKLFAAMTFAHYPTVQECRTAFVWLKEGKVDKDVFRREDAPSIWAEFMPRVARFERAYSSSKFAPKPSGLCSPNPRTGYKGCSVPMHLCPHSSRP